MDHQQNKIVAEIVDNALDGAELLWNMGKSLVKALPIIIIIYVLFIAPHM